MDEKLIHKTVLKKLSKRSQLLEKAIKPDTIKVYEITNVPNKGSNRSNRRSNFRGNSRIVYQQCLDCPPIDGLYIYRPFYKVDYLNNFYYQLEAMHYANRDNQSVVNFYNTYTLFFERMNLYQVLEYSYAISPVLGVYLFRYLVDMVYLLNIPKNLVNNFYLNSRLIIARYTNVPSTYTQLDTLIRNVGGPVVIMPLGIDVNVYDLIPARMSSIQTIVPDGSMRIFSRNGSIVVIGNPAINSWSFAIPNEFLYTGTIKYEIILYPYVHDGFQFVY